MAFDPDAYLKAKTGGGFDPDAYLQSKGVAAPAVAPVSDLERAAKSAGETAADFVTGRASVLSFLDPLVGAAGAVGSYFLPDTKTGGGDFSARMNRELEGLRRTRGEAFQRSPVVAPAGAITSAFPVAKVLQAAPAAAQAISPLTQMASRGAGGWPLVQRMVAGVGDSALVNAASSYLSNLGADPTEAAKEAFFSPYNALGAAGPVAAELPAAKREVGRAVQSVATRVLPKPTPNPAAVSLAKRGVPLTVGQLAPDSTLGIMEEASAQNAFGMAKERGAGVDSWRGLVRGAGRVEGDTLPLPTEATAANAALHDRVGAIYDDIGAMPVRNDTVVNLNSDATRRMRGIDAKTQNAALAEIKNALTVLPAGSADPLPPPEPPKPIAIIRSGRGAMVDPATPAGRLLTEQSGAVGPRGVQSRAAMVEGERGLVPGQTTAQGGTMPYTPGKAEVEGVPGQRLMKDITRPAPNTGDTIAFEAPAPAPERPALSIADLVKVRENIRAESRAAVTAQDADRVRVLKVAERAVTGVIHENLTADAAKRLAQADQAYRKIMTVQNAPPTGQVEFTPQQLLREVERGVGTRSFARGGGGELRELGDAGAATFNLRTPPTGLRQGIMSAIPWGTKLMAPAVRIANTPLIRNALFPQLAPPPSQMPTVPPTPRLQLPGAGATTAKSLQQTMPWTLAPQGAASTQAVPTPIQLAQADPVIGEAFQRGGPEAAKAAFYAESQTRPEQLLGWLNETKP